MISNLTPAKRIEEPLESVALDVRQALRKVASTSAIRFLGLACAFVFQILLSRWLGKEIYGSYIFWISLFSILSCICTLGLDVSAVKFLPQYLEAKEADTRISFINFSIVSVCIASGLVAVGLLFLSSGEESSAGYLLPLFVLLTLVRPITGIFRAERKVLLSSFLFSFLKPVILLGAVIFILNRGMRPSLQFGFGLNVFVTLPILLLSLFIIYRKTPRVLFRGVSFKRLRSWVVVSLPLLGVALASIVLTRSDIVMIGLLKGKEVAGSYGAAVRICDLVAIALVTSNMIIAPRVSAAFHRNDQRGAQSNLGVGSIVSGLFICSGALFVLLFGVLILGLFNPEYVDSSTALRILLVGQVVNGFCGPVGFVLAISGKEKVSLTIMCVTAIINISGNYFLIKQWGQNGAAVSTAFASIFWNLSMLFYIKKNLGLDTSPLWWLRGRRHDAS